MSCRNSRRHRVGWDQVKAGVWPVVATVIFLGNVMSILAGTVGSSAGLSDTRDLSKTLEFPMARLWDKQDGPEPNGTLHFPVWGPTEGMEKVNGTPGAYGNRSDEGSDAPSWLEGIRRLFKRQTTSEDHDTSAAAPSRKRSFDPGSFLPETSGSRRDQFLHDRPPYLVVVTSTQRSFGLRVQKATEKTTTTPKAPKRTRPPPLYPDRNSIREFHPPATVSGEGVGSVQVIRRYGGPIPQSSRSSSPCSSLVFGSRTYPVVSLPTLSLIFVLLVTSRLASSSSSSPPASTSAAS